MKEYVVLVYKSLQGTIYKGPICEQPNCWIISMKIEIILNKYYNLKLIIFNINCVDRNLKSETGRGLISDDAPQFKINLFNNIVPIMVYLFQLLFWIFIFSYSADWKKEHFVHSKELPHIHHTSIELRMLMLRILRYLWIALEWRIFGAVNTGKRSSK